MIHTNLSVEAQAAEVARVKKYKAGASSGGHKCHKLFWDFLTGVQVQVGLFPFGKVIVSRFPRNVVNTSLLKHFKTVLSL